MSKDTQFEGQRFFISAAPCSQLVDCKQTGLIIGEDMEHGTWVRASDYDALRAQLATARADAERAKVELAQWKDNFSNAIEQGHNDVNAEKEDHAETLRMERQAHDLIEKLKSSVDHNAVGFKACLEERNDLESRCAALSAECEDLRADKARLDWLEAYAVRSQTEIVPKWFSLLEDVAAGNQPSYRAAIDASKNAGKGA